MLRLTLRITDLGNVPASWARSFPGRLGGSLVVSLAGSLAIATGAWANTPIPGRATETHFNFVSANHTTISIFPPFRALLDRPNHTDRNPDSHGRNYVYSFYQPQGTVEVVVEQAGDRILLVDRSPVRGRKLKKRGQVVAAYQTIGLPSRVFPGLVGLRKIPPETVPNSPP
jgi:hypothetical protein